MNMGDVSPSGEVLYEDDVGVAPCGGPQADDIRPYKFYRHVPQPYTPGG